MKGPAIVVSALAVLVIAVVSVMLLDDGGGAPDGGDAAAVLSAAPDEPATTHEVGATPEQARRLDAAAAPPAELAGDPGRATAGEGVAATLSAEPPVTLVGRVVDEAGRPAEGVRLVYHDGSPRLRLGVEPAPGERPETASSRDGRFRLEVPAPAEEPDEGMRLLGTAPAGQLVAVHPAFATASKDCPTLTAGAEVTLGTITLALGASATGRVVDEAGRPVAGAAVTGHHADDGAGRGGLARLFGNLAREPYATVETGRDGRYLIHGLQAGRGAITVSADGYQMGSADGLELEPGLTAPVADIVLPEGASLAGVVLDEDGEPVEGAQVRVSSFTRLVIRSESDVPRRQLGDEMRRVAVSDADGAWQLDGLGPGQYTLHCSAEGFQKLDRPNTETGQRDLVLTLARLGGLLVRLTSAADGSPVDGATIEARPANSFPFGRMVGGGGLEVSSGAAALEAASADGDPAGVYFVHGAGSTGTELAIAAPGYAVAEVEGPGVASGGLGHFDVRLQPESIIAGVVMDDRGAAIPGARVTVSEFVPPPSFDSGNIEFRREVPIGGPGEGPAWNKVKADEQGRFEVRGVPAGDWELTAKAPGFACPDGVVLTLDQGGAQRDVELPMLPAGTIAGLVVEQDGRPAATVEISVRPMAEPGSAPVDPMAARLAAMMGGDDQQQVTTDGAGAFEVRDLLPGFYEVAFVKQRGLSMGGAMIVLDGGHGPSDGPEEIVEVRPGEATRVELVRPPTARLTGRVLAGGRPAPDTTVTLSDAQDFMGFGGQKATTDAGGHYEFSGVEPGDYQVSAQVAGAALPEKHSVTLEGGLEAQQDLVFSGVTISGRVVDADSGDGVGGVVVNVSRTSGTREPEQVRMISMVMSAGPGGGGGGMSMELGGGDLSKVRTAPDGSFAVHWLKPGEYGIQTTGGSYARAEAGPFTVADQSIDDVLIEAVRGASISGRVISGETGELLDGAPVSLVGASGSREMSMTEGGHYRFEGLAAGDYDVNVMGTGFGGGPIATEPVRVAQGEDRVLDLTTDNDMAAAGVGGQRMIWNSPAVTVDHHGAEGGGETSDEIEVEFGGGGDGH